MDHASDSAKPKRRRWVYWSLGVAVIFGFLAWRVVLWGMHGTEATWNRGMLKQIGLALHTYHDDYGRFPPAYVTDKDGNPMHSWRVLILPYMDQGALYKAYDFSEPWDGPHNIRLLDKRPVTYGGRFYDGDKTKTHFAAMVGDPCIFRGAVPVSLSEVTDGSSNTLIIGEAVGAGIPWTEPRDIEFEKFTRFGDPNGLNGFDNIAVTVLCADGSVFRIIADQIDGDARAWFTRAGGEEIPRTD
ncbi:hypothetical protein Mal52_57850 [Symmachiella dynata]|uniref:DUF1559 domain-containing protein n=1 Tax=Symmachiella dynata TaxID=2527995 RepID=A0A517ZXQ5_9PLAN|nr:DUF1559 domain-containing protein [Symmachiella dynata]QDU47257.1 hypothetical protein Mal52_57850 [Symmachiella dynata]